MQQKTGKVKLADLHKLLDEASGMLGKVKNQPMPLREAIDLGARMRTLIKTAEAFDKAIKEEIKQELGNAPGTLNGEVVKAVVTEIKSNRFDLERFRLEEPAMAEEYTSVQSSLRVNYEVK